MQPQASLGTFSTRTIDVGFTEDSLRGEAGALAVNKASTVSDKKADQHCGRYHNRSLNICEDLVVRPDWTRSRLSKPLCMREWRGDRQSGRNTCKK